MLKRLRFKNTTLEELLTLEQARLLREAAPVGPPGSVRERLIRKGRRCHLRDWLNSPGLQSPK